MQEIQENVRSNDVIAHSATSIIHHAAVTNRLSVAKTARMFLPALLGRVRFRVEYVLNSRNKQLNRMRDP